MTDFCSLFYAVGRWMGGGGKVSVGEKVFRFMYDQSGKSDVDFQSAPYVSAVYTSNRSPLIMAFPALTTADGACVDLSELSDTDAARYVWGVLPADYQPSQGKRNEKNCVV